MAGFKVLPFYFVLLRAQIIQYNYFWKKIKTSNNAWKDFMEERDYLEILKQLTLEEKASLCSGDSFWTTKAIERLNIPSVRVSDGPNGLRREKDTGGTNVMQVSEPATCFPTAVTAASSWDEELLEEEGAAIANEALSLGVTTVLGT